MSAGKRFEGKVALITASTAGIGLEIAHRLGLEGAKLFVCSRKENKVVETLEQLRGRGYEAEGCAANVGKLEDIQRIVKLAVSAYGKIDVLVSNAAVNPAVGGILDLPDWAIRKMLDVNVQSAIQLIREAKPHMHKGSSIVMVSSYAAYHAEPPIAMYAVTKTTVVALCKALAMELGPEGIRVNCIAPGVVPTRFAAAIVETPEMEELHKSRTWLGRLGTSQDMAAGAAYLASDDAAYVTGETLIIAGGIQSRL